MRELPSEFVSEMKSLLSGDEFENYLNSYEKGRFYGLRVNTDKISVTDFLKISPFHLTPIPWTTNGFYYEEAERPAKHPYYYAGLYYLQEPSAMLPAELLPVSENDLVLDVCAAPGGKSTAFLNKRPKCLFSNDISNSRAQALLKNLELFGGTEYICLSEDPKKFTERFTGFFDKILIDAPCSGEGMFRKEPAVIKSWLEHGHGFYVSLQKSIVENALKMLKDGGMLVYSTCTFSVSEDEDLIAFMKSLSKDVRVLSGSVSSPGLSSGIRSSEDALSQAELASLYRIFPHRADGEGHFAALIQKGAACAPDSDPQQALNFTEIEGFQALPKEAREFLSPIKKRVKNGRFEVRNGKVSVAPDISVPLNGLRIVRNGLFVGELLKNRFEPSEALAMSLKKGEFPNEISFSADDPDTLRYLKGETVILTDETAAKDGWVLVLTDGFPLGFAKKSGNVLKNKYLPGWRCQT